MTAVVWVIAPLSGVLVQPYVGVLSDQCQSPWGRRRPFILAGTIGCIVCMLGLATTKPVIHTLAGFVNADPYSSASRGLILALAISCLAGLYIAIQPLQAGIRSLIVDSCPAHQQTIASAWASRLTGVGNIIGYLFGFVPVRYLLPSLRVSQFAWLCIVATVILGITSSITCYFIKEQNPRTLPSPMIESRSFFATLRHIAWSARTMPKMIRQVCVVQFFAWLGWFPYLFYISSYVGDLCMFPIL
jgi:solute carrier family 45 protein 1/2/4